MCHNKTTLTQRELRQGWLLTQQHQYRQQNGFIDVDYKLKHLQFH